MKEILYQGKYYQFEYDKELKFFEIKSLPKSSEMDGYKDKIMTFMHKLGEMLESVPEIHYLMDNHQDRDWVISIETQKWVADNLFPIAVRKGTKKMAHIPPPELIASISSEQMIDDAQETHDQLFPILIFETYEEGMRWLLEE